ncbi:MAG: metal ABC transporter substrate-binding protein [Actinomycetota bacterium]
MAALVILVLSALFAGCAAEGGGDGRLKVAADIVPMADFCEQVGGDLVEVETMVPPGASPHSYELTTGQMRFLEEAEVLVTVGMDLDPWAEEVFADVVDVSTARVVAGEAVPAEELIAAGDEGSGPEQETGGHERGLYDPHVWLDPVLAMGIVEAIGEGLAEADPAHAAAYRANAEDYIRNLAELDAEIAEKAALFSRREFVAFHSSWVYFARRYGLEQVGVIEELPGKEPSAGEIADLVALVEAGGVGVIFAEPQFSPRAAEAIAEESGGRVVVKILDPLGDPDDPEYDTYLKMMRRNVEVMGEALR